MIQKEFSDSNGAKLVGYSTTGLCYFGMWNYEASPVLFSQLEEWARTQGHSQIFGPIDGSTLGNYRLRLNAFEQNCFWGEPSNTEAPVLALKALGFRVAEKYFSYVCNDIEKLRPLMETLELKIPKEALNGLSFERLNLQKWSEMEGQICDAANLIFAKNFAFMPMSREDFAAVYSKPVLDKICDKTSLLVWNQERALVGFCVNFKDVNDPQRILIKTAGVIEPYRRMGLTFFEMIRRVFHSDDSFNSAILCLMREGNVPSLFLKDFADEVREYGLFCKEI